LCPSHPPQVEETAHGNDQRGRNIAVQGRKQRTVMAQGKINGVIYLTNLLYEYTVYPY